MSTDEKGGRWQLNSSSNSDLAITYGTAIVTLFLTGVLLAGSSPTTTTAAVYRRASVGLRAANLSPPQPSLLDKSSGQLCPCKDGNISMIWQRGRDKIPRLSPVDSEQCFVRTWRPLELARCIHARGGWLMFVGDSELRGIVLSLLVTLLGTDGRDPTPAEWLGIDLEAHARKVSNSSSEAAAMLKALKQKTATKVDVGALDWFVRLNSATGHAVEVVKWAALKHEMKTDLIVPSEFDLRYNLNGPPAAAFDQWQRRSSDPKSVWIRISYAFTQDSFSLINRELPTLVNQINMDTALILNAGKWDLWWLNQHADHWIDHTWYQDNGLNRWSLEKGEPAYRALYAKLEPLCANRECIFAEVGNGFKWRQPRTDEYVATIDRIVQSMPSLRMFSRWKTTAAMLEHMVDHAHFDNFVNTWEVHQLVGMLCSSDTCTNKAPTACTAEGACGNATGRGVWHSRCAIMCG